MSSGPDSGGAGEDRYRAASEWFARLRGPDADGLRADFEEWYCEPANRRAYAEMEAIWTASASARPALAAPRRQRLRPGLVAASMAAAVTLGLLVHGHLGRGVAQGEHTYGSGRGVIREVELADGSRVTLDTASQVRTAFGRDERRVVLLAGRARFRVSHDAVHPFVVTAAGHVIVARGTVFDVRIDDGAAQVTLIEGAVDLERRDGRGRAQLVGRLRPGETALFAQSDPRPRIASAPPASWTSGVVTAGGTRLADLLREAGRYSARPIRLGDPGLADLTVSGGFRPADTEQLAQALAVALGLRVVHGSDGSVTLARSAGAPFVPPQCRDRRCAAR